jgi:hypothetical protein
LENLILLTPATVSIAYGLESASNAMATSTSDDPQEALPISSICSSIRQDNNSATEGNKLPRASGTAVSDSETQLGSLSVSVLVDMLSYQGRSITGTEEEKIFKSAEKAMGSMITQEFRGQFRNGRPNIFDTPLHSMYTEFTSR